MWVTKLLISLVKIWLKIVFLFILGQALLAHLVPLVGWLVVVARGMYLARHLFTLLFLHISIDVHSLGSRVDKIKLKRNMPVGKLCRVGKEKEREEKHCQLPYICFSIFLLMLFQRNFKEAP